MRIAVLAALNIADECFQLRRRAGEASQDSERKAAARAELLARQLGAALGE